MEFNVRFRVNKNTGQVELFEVDHEGRQTLDDAEHNRIHDRLTAEIGRQIERNPLIQEMLRGALPENETEPEDAIEGETTSETEEEKQAE